MRASFQVSISLALLLAMTPAAFGQQTQSAPNSTTPAADSETPKTERPKLELFLKLRKDIIKAKNDINVTYANIPVGFPVEQKKALARIDQLEAMVITLEQKVHRAVVDAYIEAPNENNIVNQAVAVALNRSLDPVSPTEKFNPKMALEISRAMLDNDIAPTTVLFAAFRAAYGLQDFPLANTMLERLKKTNNGVAPELTTQLETTTANWEKELQFREKEKLADDLPRVEFDTSTGKFIVELFENEAPNTVANFVNLVEKGYYDGNTFHLVKPGVLAQSGCPEGNATSNPGYRIPDECDGDSARHHFAGSLSMLVSEKDTGGAIFFFTFQPNNFLDGKYTVFGRILGDLDPLYQLNTIDTTTALPADRQPSKINKITVVRKRPHPYQPNKLPEESSSTPPTTSDPTTSDPTTNDKIE